MVKTTGFTGYFINNTIESYPNIISLNIKIYKYEIDGIYRYTYVKFGDIPDEYQRKFADWMIGQTCGVIDEKFVPYAWDLERWLNLKINKVPTYWD